MDKPNFDGMPFGLADIIEVLVSRRADDDSLSVVVWVRIGGTGGMVRHTAARPPFREDAYKCRDEVIALVNAARRLIGRELI